jgi:hypothetical protein
MSADADASAADAATFRCPVCRARQTLRDECRRCRADLRLVARAHRRAHYLLAQRQQARTSGDVHRERLIAAELAQLAPQW